MEEVRRWEDMDRDCLVNIFQKLGLDDLAISMPFVCKSWLKASLDPLCWKILNFQALDFMPWSQFAKRFAALYSLSNFSFSAFVKFAIARSCGLAVELQFPIIFWASLKDLAYAADKCPRLKILVLSNMTTEAEMHMPELIRKLKDLEQLEMNSKPSSFMDLVTEININCKKFSRLRMLGSIKKENALAIVNYLPKLECLDLSKSYLPKEVLLVILDGCKSVESLKVSDCIGFGADDQEVLNKASRIRIFQHEGSKVEEDFSYDSDEFDPLYVLVV